VPPTIGDTPSAQTLVVNIWTTFQKRERITIVLDLGPRIDVPARAPGASAKRAIVDNESCNTSFCKNLCKKWLGKLLHVAPAPGKNNARVWPRTVGEVKESLQLLPGTRNSDSYRRNRHGLDVPALAV
jgi:hypothetical protein